MKGRFRGNRPDQTVRLKEPVKGRYMKFVAVNEQTGQPFASVAELDVVEAK